MVHSYIIRKTLGIKDKNIKIEEKMTSEKIKHLSINVALGKRFNQGDVAVILKAMKMENEIIAPADGVIQEILVNA